MMNRFFQIISGMFFSLLFIGGLLVIIFLLPTESGWKVFIVQTGSMEPEISVGSLILVRNSEDYNVGDIITKRSDKTDGKTITHRVSEKTQTDDGILFQTKGDANELADSEKISQDRIIGKVVWNSFFLGRIASFLKTPQGWILAVILPASLIVVEEIGKIKKEIAKMRKRKRDKKEGESEVREQRMEEKVEPVLEKKPQSQGSLQKNRPPQRNFSAPAPKKAVRRKMDL